MSDAKNDAKQVKSVFFRRCHVCDVVTEKEGEMVNRCGHCGKAMAPFYFFEDEKVQPLSEHDFRPPRQSGGRFPVRGLTAYW